MKKKIAATIIIAMAINIIIIYRFYLSEYGINIIDNIKNISLSNTSVISTGIKLFIIIISILFMTNILVKAYKKNNNDI